MKKWTCPHATVEQFEANEYVAACWGVACSVGPSNEYEKNNFSGSGKKTWADLGCSHASDHCGFSGNQVIYDDNNDGTAERMMEVNTDGLSTLRCTLYTDSNYNTTKSLSTVKTGDYIYWTTAADNRIWHHQGTVFSTVPNHPNRS